MKHTKILDMIFWTLNYLGMGVIGLYWIGESVANIRITRDEVNGLPHLPPMCANSFTDPLLLLFNVILPIIFFANLAIVINAYRGQYLKLHTAKILMSITCFVMVFLALFSQRTTFATMLAGEPFLSSIWWWPFGDIQ